MIFSGLVALRTLDLSQNSLEKLDNKTNGLLDDCLSLERVGSSQSHFYYLLNEFLFSIHCLESYVLNILREFQVNLSHNKISFITRKTFPSDPYIPYKLKDVDLSYNAMPIITFDLTVGTKKLEKLNLSNNAISDIRRCE